MKLISYELNEVPWPVIDEYIRRKPNSAFATLLKKGCQLTTETHDSGELHPWTTWPTFHRGVYNNVHDIRFINQAILTPYAPIWEILAQAGYSVGVFGSLQSWPIPQELPFSFYVPDTFAQDSQTHPVELSAFQTFNLEQTKRDGAIAQKIRPLKYLGTFVSLMRQGLRLKTVAKVAGHVVKEKINPDYKTIRSTMQAPVAFDFYWKLLNHHKPDFASFFSNHVAGMMHRYWKYLFPQEFNYTLQSKRDFFLAKNIMRAMDIAEVQIKKLMQFCDEQDYTLLVSSSMGQEAIERGEYQGEFRIQNPERFIEKLGFTGQIKNTLAMQPDFAFICKNEAVCNQFKQEVEGILNEKSEPLFEFKVSGLTININLNKRNYTAETIKSKAFYREGVLQNIADYGIDVIKRDPGTGYHQPKGIAVFYGKTVLPNADREKIESVRILPTLLIAYHIPLQNYMAKPLTQIFEHIP